MTDVFDRVRAANPIPDTDRYVEFVAGTHDQLLGSIRDRRDRMSVDEIRNLETPPRTSPERRSWKIAVATAAAVLVLVVGGAVAFVVVGEGSEVAETPSTTTAAPEPEALTPESLAGNEFRVVSGWNQNLPEQLVFDEDGAFQVIDDGRTVDSGTYTIEGDQISFVSVWEEGRAPEGWGIWWTNDDDGSGANYVLKADKCEGVVGEYQLLFEAPTTVTLKVVFDECIQRNYVANGLQLELADGG